MTITSLEGALASGDGVARPKQRGQIFGVHLNGPSTARREDWPPEFDTVRLDFGSLQAEAYQKEKGFGRPQGLQLQKIHVSVSRFCS